MRTITALRTLTGFVRILCLTSREGDGIFVQDLTQFTKVSIAITVNIMTKYEDILCDANNLYRAYLASVKTSKWKENTQRFMMNYLKNIFDISDELRFRTLKNDNTREFFLSERGKIRPITSLSVHDRIIRHALCDDIFMPIIKRHIVYDTGSSVKGRGTEHQRKRFEIHLHRYFKRYGNNGWILFGDFSKFYDNIPHDIAKKELLKLVENDEFLEWLLNIIFDGFRVDASSMSDDEYKQALNGVFDKVKCRSSCKENNLGLRYLDESINFGDQLAQLIGIYYPHRIDTYVKYVRQQPFYGRYADDWYIMSPDRQELEDILNVVTEIAKSYGIHINRKKTKIVSISKQFKFLQVMYRLSKNGKVIKKISPEKVKTVRQKIKKLHRKVANGEMKYDKVEEFFRSWMGSHYKILTKIQRKNLISLYENLFDINVSISNKKMIFTSRSKT